MSFHMGGWGEDIDAAGALVNLTALDDAVLATNGDNLQVPPFSKLVGLGAGVGSGGDGYARLASPSLLAKSRIYISPINGNADADVETSEPPRIMDLRQNPIGLVESEDATVEIESNTGAAAWQWVLGLWANGPIAPISGEIFTVRVTNTSTLTARQWSAGALTFQDALPAGRYAIVGLRYTGATAIAARVVFKGLSTGMRPGSLGGDTEDGQDAPMFRYGGLGNWGEFEHNLTPDLEFLADVADTSQEAYLDLIQMRRGPA